MQILESQLVWLLLVVGSTHKKKRNCFPAVQKSYQRLYPEMVYLTGKNVFILKNNLSHTLSCVSACISYCHAQGVQGLSC